jgi:hypothetical protein
MATRAAIATIINDNEMYGRALLSFMAVLFIVIAGNIWNCFNCSLTSTIKDFTNYLNDGLVTAFPFWKIERK